MEISKLKPRIFEFELEGNILNTDQRSTFTAGEEGRKKEREKRKEKQKKVRTKTDPEGQVHKVQQKIILTERR